MDSLTDEDQRLKKTVHSELRDKLDEIDSSTATANRESVHCVLPSKINPDGPGAPPPMHIPMSTAIRVLQERERKESEINQMNAQQARSPRPTTPTTPTNSITPPQSRNGTLGRDGTLSGDKLMISHGKRNFTITSTGPKKITIKNEKLVPKSNLLGGEGKMSYDLKKLIAADAENVVQPPSPPKQQIVSDNVQKQQQQQLQTQSQQPLIKSPQMRSNPDAFRQKHLNSPEAIEISNTLKRLITQDKVDTVPHFKAEVALPGDHKISDQLKKLILEDINKVEHASVSSPTSNSSFLHSHTNGHHRTTPVSQDKPLARHPKSSPISPSVKNGSLIDNSIRIPLPPRVPSPPPLENPKRLDSQLSCERLNKEFQVFNAYRAADPPTPKKINIPMDPNGAPNYEKKTVVSFSQDLAGSENRYPDTVKVVRTVQNGDTMQKLGMGNIKFIIDPEDNENVLQVST